MLVGLQLLEVRELGQYLNTSLDYNQVVVRVKLLIEHNEQLADIHIVFAVESHLHNGKQCVLLNLFLQIPLGIETEHLRDHTSTELMEELSESELNCSN